MYAIHVCLYWTANNIDFTIYNNIKCMKVARGGGGGEESIEHAICTVPTIGKVTILPAYCMCD